MEERFICTVEKEFPKDEKHADDKFKNIMAMQANDLQKEGYKNVSVRDRNKTVVDDKIKYTAKFYGEKSE